MYTAAAGTTGKKYFILFDGNVLQVLEKGAAGTVLVIKGGSNLIDASTTENATGIINRVVACDGDGNQLQSFVDEESAALFGVMQRVIRQGDGGDAAAKAADLLKGAQPEQKITVHCLRDRSAATGLVSGGSVMLQEPATGLYGRFFIDADTHRWANGIYTNELVLNLDAVMDGKEAGEALNS